MAQRLAAVYDPSGALFNVKPVTTLEDGRVVTLEAIERQKEKIAEKARQNEMKDQGEQVMPENHLDGADRLNPERMKMLIESKMAQKPGAPQGMSKTQMKKQEMLAPRPPLPKPTIPEGIDLPSDEEENWLDLWSLPDEELEKRVLKEKRKKARERKDLRVRQKTGKAERRAARDEKRRVYREIKQSWKIIREEERRRRAHLQAMEDEENKALAVEVTNMNRKQAMEVCAELGFTLETVEGVGEIVPKALGMKGVDVDFDKLEVVGDGPSSLKVKVEERRDRPRSNRVDLGAIADEKYTEKVYAGFGADQDGSMNANFVELGSGIQGQDHQELRYNHKLRRKLRRAIESAQIRKELLVREAAIKHCEEKGIEVPAILRTAAKPQSVRGARTMPDGTLETAKQERVRSRVELAEFNKMAKILRRQAKEMAVEAGVRIYLELTGRIPKREGLDELVEARARAQAQPNGSQQPNGEDSEEEEEEEEEGIPVGGIWPARSTAAMTMEDFMSSWPIPEDPLARPMDVDETPNGAKSGSTSSDEESGSDASNSDTDMSDAS